MRRVNGKWSHWMWGNGWHAGIYRHGRCWNLKPHRHVFPYHTCYWFWRLFVSARVAVRTALPLSGLKGKTMTPLEWLIEQTVRGGDWAWSSICDQETAQTYLPWLIAQEGGAKRIAVVVSNQRGPIDLSPWLPHLHGEPECSTCHHRWVGVWPYGLELGECPNCHQMTQMPQLGKDVQLTWRWLIVRGGDQPLHPEWVRSLRDLARSAGVAFNFQGWGEWGSTAEDMQTGEPAFRMFTSFAQWVNKGSTWVNGGTCIDMDGKVMRRGADFLVARYPIAIVRRVGYSRSGRLLDGVVYDEWPEEVKGRR